MRFTRKGELDRIQLYQNIKNDIIEREMIKMKDFHYRERYKELLTLEIVSMLTLILRHIFCYVKIC